MKKKIVLNGFLGISIFFLYTVLALAQDKQPAQNKPIADLLSETVIFLFSQDAKIPLGTGFIIGYPIPDSDSTRFIPLVVTAKHVIGDRSQVIGRFSGKSGEAFIGAPYDLEALRKSGDLWEHPDDGVDIVIFPTMHFPESQYTPIPLDLIASEQDFKNEQIHVMDHVVMPGLLLNFMGSSKNCPVFRSGSIALLPEEKMPLDYPVGTREIKTEQQVILLNALAVPGASGSPVFLEPLTPRTKGAELMMGAKPYLLGIIHGFCPTAGEIFKVEIPTETKDFCRENSGVAVIFPSWRIREILDSDKLKKRMSQLIEQEKAVK